MSKSSSSPQVIPLESFVIRLESFPIFLHFDIIGYMTMC